ncbi:hypothetical protein ACQU0X_21065 [Pseudovibrio ascidiaceicola]|uniref:hypothetical protein n=1 Tax=Pseudovibrio ascidiaceicola TaxID=285279 RepID=UPI003D36FFA1
MVGIRIILCTDNHIKLQSSFGIDLIAHALEADFELQRRAVDIMAQFLIFCQSFSEQASEHKKPLIGSEDVGWKTR